MDENDWTARFVDSMKKLMLELGINDKYIISDNQGRGYSFKAFNKNFQSFTVYHQPTSFNKMQGCGTLCIACGQLCDVNEDMDGARDASQFVIKVSQPFCGRMKPSIFFHLTKKLLD